MQIIDLTHTITAGMPVYPGTEQPLIAQHRTMVIDGFREKKLTFCSHIGTHIDAPAHMVAEGKTLDQLPVEQFYGRACLYSHKAGYGATITLQYLLSLQDVLKRIDFLLISTGWDQYWGTEQYFINFPVLAQDAAEWLARQGLKGVGFDVISADAADSKDYAVHQVLLKNNIVIIENLKNLVTLAGGPFFFSCLPLHIAEADGSPVRAMAIM